MSLFLSPIGNGAQFFDANGYPLNAGLIYTYQAGSTTPQATYTTSAGITQNANPIVLGVDGRPANEIWFTSSIAYKLVLQDSTNNVIATYDNLAGINDTSSLSFSEWIASNLTPTYLSGTSFSVTGNQANIFPVNMRIKTSNTGGTIYSSVSTSTYNSGTGLTTVVIVNDAGTLDSGLSAVYYGFANPAYPSVGVAQNALIVAVAASVSTTVSNGAVGTTQAVGDNSTKIATDAFVSLSLRSYLAGLGMSTAGSSVTMSIAAGVAQDSTNTVLMYLAAISKTTASWVVGTAGGGLDTGATGGAASTWYYWYLIRRPDTGVVDAIFSLSSSAPTLPTNYTQYRYIGAAKLDGSKNWTAFTQVGRKFAWSTPVLDSSAAQSATASLITLTVPLGRKMETILNINAGSSAALTYVSDPANADLAPSASVAPLAQANGAYGIAINGVMTNTSAQVRIRCDGAHGFSSYIVTCGWVDLADTNL